MKISKPSNISTRTTFRGVSQLARETGLSQGYISRLLRDGWPVSEIRAKAELAAFRRSIREELDAEREREERAEQRRRRAAVKVATKKKGKVKR